MAGDNETFNIELLNACGDAFMIEENGWKVTAIKAEPSQKGAETIQTYINMMITDSQGNVEVITANRENYKGVVQLHQSLRYLSLSSDWITANKRKFHIELKKLFTRLKNGRFIHDTIYLNPDEDYSIDLSFENGQFVMSSYIETGDFLMERKNEEIYKCGLLPVYKIRTE